MPLLHFFCFFFLFFPCLYVYMSIMICLPSVVMEERHIPPTTTRLLETAHNNRSIAFATYSWPTAFLLAQRSQEQTTSRDETDETKKSANPLTPAIFLLFSSHLHCIFCFFSSQSNTIRAAQEGPPVLGLINRCVVMGHHLLPFLKFRR